MDPIKWYSAALRAAERLPQNFGTKEQMAALLSKYGAKQSELNYLKVPDFLNQFGGGRVSKSSLYDYIDKNKVLPQEVVKQGSGIGEDPEAQVNAILANPRAFETLTGLRYNALDQRGRFNALGDIAPEQFDEFFQNHSNDLFDQRSKTKYSDYASHPDSNYKETLVTLPQKQLSLDEFRAKYHRDPLKNEGLIDEDPLYQSSHWDEPNVLFHMRSSSPGSFDMRLPMKENGQQATSIPFLEELQSDWGQAGRKQGFKPSAEDMAEVKRQSDIISARLNDRIIGLREAGISHNALAGDQEVADLSRQLADLSSAYRNPQGISSAPLVTNTNDWAGAGVRRFLAEAAQQDAPQVAWTTGAQQSARYQGHAPEGMSGFYDKMLPNLFMKYLKPYGGKVEAAQPDMYSIMDQNGKAFANYSTEDLARVNLTSRASWDSDAANYSITPRYSRDSGPHTATLPPALRQKILEEGIPFFRKGGFVDKYSTVI